MFAVVAGGLCPFWQILGIPCMGCGMTRAWVSVLRLDFGAAFFWHPLFLLGPVVVLAGFWKTGYLFKSKKWSTVFWIALAVLFIGFYLWRMFLYFPDTSPMDYNWDSVLGKIIRFIQPQAG